MGVYTLLSSSVPSRELFLGGIFRSFLKDTTNNILKRYKRDNVDIKIEEKSPYVTACTNGNIIKINYNYYQIQELKEKTLQFKYMRGFNGHELGHVLFDDFTILKKIQDLWRNGIIYPLSKYESKISEEQKMCYDEILSVMKENENIKTALLKLYLELDNILADSFVNYQVIKRLPTYKDDLTYILRYMRKKLNSYDELEQSKLTKAQKIFIYIHDYSVFDLLFDVDDELVNEVVRLAPLLEKIKVETDSEIRTVYYQIIFCELWKYIKDCIQSSQKEQNDSSPENENGSTSSIGNQCSSENEMEDANELNALAQMIANASMSKRPQNVFSTSVMQKTDGIFENTSLAEGSDGERQQIIEDIQLRMSDPVTESDGKFEQLLKAYQKEKEYIEKEVEHSSELNQFNDSLDFKNHKNLLTAISRQITVKDEQKDIYERVFQKQVLITARKISERIKDSLIKRESMESCAGYYCGKRINFPAIVRQELKVFERNKNLGKKTESAFMIICDESGSTNGERNYYLRMASMIFLQVAEILKFPVGIIGHKAETIYSDEVTSEQKYADVVLNVYSDFANDDRDKYRLVSMTPCGCNRDGYAIQFACERLLKREEENKICIILTDGKPNARGYTGFAAKQDCKMLYEKYKSKGVMVIVAAIGDDKREIKEIYEDSFLDVKALEDIPKVFSKILKEVYKI